MSRTIDVVNGRSGRVFYLNAIRNDVADFRVLLVRALADFQRRKLEHRNIKDERREIVNLDRIGSQSKTVRGGDCLTVERADVHFEKSAVFDGAEQNFQLARAIIRRDYVDKITRRTGRRSKEIICRREAEIAVCVRAERV